MEDLFSVNRTAINLYNLVSRSETSELQVDRSDVACTVLYLGSVVPNYDGNYGSLKGAGSYGSVPFREPFKRAVFSLRGRG